MVALSEKAGAMTLSQPCLTDFHEAVAAAHGIALFGRYEETEAANILGYSLVAFRRFRTAGRIGCVKPSPRKIFYFGYQLVEFLLTSVEETTCPVTPVTRRSSSVPSGSPSVRTLPPGVAHGSTHRPDRHAALASAQRILMKPVKG